MKQLEGVFSTTAMDDSTIEDAFGQLVYTLLVYSLSLLLFYNDSNCITDGEGTTQPLQGDGDDVAAVTVDDEQLRFVFQLTVSCCTVNWIVLLLIHINSLLSLADELMSDELNAAELMTFDEC